jgi:hypothetical protein
MGLREGIETIKKIATVEAFTFSLSRSHLLSSMHHNSNMLIHILLNTPQPARGQNRHPAKSNTHIINPLVTLRIRNLPSLDNGFVSGLVACDSGDLSQPFQQGGPRQLDGVGDVGHVGDVQVLEHDAADVVFGVGEEFVEENVVVDGVADAAADDADGEG